MPEQMNIASFTPGLFDWRFFSKSATVHTLIALALMSADSEDGVVEVSIRSLARRCGLSHKEIRTALQRLQEDSIIELSATHARTTVRFLPWSSLSDSLFINETSLLGVPGAQMGAHQKAQAKAHQKAHLSYSEIPVNKGISEVSATDNGTPKGTNHGTPKGKALGTGAHQKAHSEAHVASSETSASKGVFSVSVETKGTPKGTASDTQKIDSNKNKKKNPSLSLPPSPPISITPSKEKEKTKKKKKNACGKNFYNEVMEKFNAAFAAFRNIRKVRSMSPERCEKVRCFVEDFSADEIDTLLHIAASSTKLTSGRGGKQVSFDMLFNPQYYFSIMEGAWSTDEPSFTATTDEEPQQRTSWQQLAVQEARQKEAQRLEQQKKRFTEMIDNPSPRSKAILAAAYNDGTLARLGINYTPSITEQLSSLSASAGIRQHSQQPASSEDLSYIQSLINR